MRFFTPIGCGLRSSESDQIISSFRGSFASDDQIFTRKWGKDGADK